VNILEVIELRSVKKNKPQVLELFDKLFGKEIEKTDMTIKIFTHSTIETDYSIHIYYKGEKEENFESMLGYKISSYLKEYGLVNYNIWIDKTLGRG